MPGTSQLRLYNHALRLLGERELASLSEDREPRRLLDAVWNDSGKRRVLESGLWNFATRTVKVDAEVAVTPAFGLRYAFTRPTDFVRIVALCSDPMLKTPLLDYRDDSAYWYADITPIYLRYVSDDATTYGGNLATWTESFCEWAAFYFADQVRPKLTGFRTDADRKQWKADVKKALRTARSRDAMNQPTAFPPTGNWVGARQGGRGGGDRGNRGSLTG